MQVFRVRTGSDPFDRDHPVFLDPTPDELARIGNHWSVIRIGLIGEDRLVLGDGYGNCHSTLAHCIGTTLGRTAVLELHFTPLILYRSAGHAYINASDCGGGGRVPASKWFKYLGTKQYEVLRDLCVMSEVALR